jgi:hypothetical protein
VFDPKGKVKTVIPEKELKQIHWKKFEAEHAPQNKKGGSAKNKRGRGRTRSKN